ncbi:MAG: hypothetical protein FWH17_00705 [Oscillospiraceae bacterium]|nr:hypothetical protein [Oscillospiraceae bacterium]
MRTATRMPVSLRRQIYSTPQYAPGIFENEEEHTEKADSAAVCLGHPITAPCLIPVLHSSTPSCINNPFMVNGKPYRVTALSFGAPHAAVFVDDVQSVDVQSVGSALGTHPLFPEGASVVFIQPLGKDSVAARLWQQKRGEIPFTREAGGVAGTAAMMLQKVLYNEISVHMGERSYAVKWDRNGDGVSITE